MEIILEKPYIDSFVRVDWTSYKIILYEFNIWLWIEMCDKSCSTKRIDVHH